MSYQDFYLTGPYADYVTSHRSAGNGDVFMVEAQQPAGDMSDPAVPQFLLTRMLSDLDAVFDFGAGIYDGHHIRGQFALCPPNFANRIEVRTRHRIRMFALPADQLSSIAERAGLNFSDDLNTLHSAPFNSKRLDFLSGSLWSEAAHNEVYGGLLADSLLTLITVELYRLSQRKTRDMQRTTKLDDAKLKTVFEYMKAHPNAKSSLADLSALVGLSEYHFLRCFKESMGTTPHQYLMERRIAEAQNLLATTKLSLADVAIDSGFSSQSHMSDVFRKKLSTTPGRWRKQAK
ncbi:AraC family transcriptional regulator [uncultured Roseobacter sp.]|uniref:AraC family transcriptional regulator n=1 Tax=uncultured Roseobacter sp. TaxID=114847 RepID=UPI00261B1819|nr:AraC family transcriptional regulator [uncultured Roseobacter sp.]